MLRAMQISLVFSDEFGGFDISLQIAIYYFFIRGDKTGKKQDKQDRFAAGWA